MINCINWFAIDLPPSRHLVNWSCPVTLSTRGFLAVILRASDHEFLTFAPRERPLGKSRGFAARCRPSADTFSLQACRERTSGTQGSAQSEWNVMVIGWNSAGSCYRTWGYYDASNVHRSPLTVSDVFITYLKFFLSLLSILDVSLTINTSF